MSPNSIIQTLFLSAAALTLRTSPGWAQTPRPPADQWVTNFVHFPSTVATNEVRLKGFETLQTEAVARRLKITWQPERVDTNFNVVVFISTDGIGHWPARDWHAYPMSARGGKWETSVPADSLDTPMVYFLRSASSATTNYSLMRIVRPRIAGLTEPSRPFWPFLEGFEDSIESWHVVAAPDETLPPLKRDPLAKNGRSSLLVTLPEGKLSVTAATTRLRGWQIEENFATGVRVWVRTKSGTGRARFTLLANANSTNQVVSVFPKDSPVTDRWERVDLPFDLFPKVPLGEVDLFTIEFIGDHAGEFLIDNVSLLGRWKLEVE